MPALHPLPRPGASLPALGTPGKAPPLNIAIELETIRQEGERLVPHGRPRHAGPLGQLALIVGRAASAEAMPP